MLSTVILAGPVENPPLMKGLLTTKTVRPFQSNLVATIERVEETETVESYMNRQIEGLRQADVVREEVRKPERVLLAGGLEGLITEQVILGATGERVRQMQLISIKNGIAHTLITSQLDGVPFESVRDQFRRMLQSFALAHPAGPARD
jgi:hypothetical protein